MIIQLNGQLKELNDVINVSQLLVSLGLQGKRIAVEVNGELVPRSEHGNRKLSANDKVEIVHAIGGG